MRNLLGTLALLGSMMASGGAQAGIIDVSVVDNGNGTIGNTGTCVDTTCDDLTKTYIDIGPMDLILTLDAGTRYTINETITNDTGIDWTDFHWILILDGSGNVGAFGSPVVIPAFGNITTTGDMIWADAGIVPDGGSFTASFHIDASFFLEPLLQVTLRQIPSIPEPGTLAVLGLGLAGLGMVRRRKVV